MFCISEPESCKVKHLVASTCCIFHILYLYPVATRPQPCSHLHCAAMVLLLDEMHPKGQYPVHSQKCFLGSLKVENVLLCPNYYNLPKKRQQTYSHASTATGQMSVGVICPGSSTILVDEPYQLPTGMERRSIFREDTGGANQKSRSYVRSTKVKPMQKCLKPTFFLMASRGRFHWLQISDSLYRCL